MVILIFLKTQVYHHQLTGADLLNLVAVVEPASFKEAWWLVIGSSVRNI